MCRLVFIATAEPITLIPRDESAPAFYIEPVANEDAAVKDKFSNKNVYYVGSTRGCGCSFRRWSSYADVEPDMIAIIGNTLAAGIMKIVDVIRGVMGTREKWLAKVKKSVEQGLLDDANDKADHEKLVSIIEANTIPGSNVELYCTWAGDYTEPAGDTEVINLNEVDLMASFRVCEDMVTVYTRS